MKAKKLDTISSEKKLKNVTYRSRFFYSFHTSDLIHFTYNAKKTRNQTFAVGKTAEVAVVYGQNSMDRQ